MGIKIGQTASQIRVDGNVIKIICKTQEAWKDAVESRGANQRWQQIKRCGRMVNYVKIEVVKSLKSQRAKNF